MGTAGTFFNFDLFLGEVWGFGDEFASCYSILGTASNVVVGTNPPYSLADFYAIYPKFAGNLLQGITGTVALGSPTVTGVSNLNQGFAVGQFVSSPAFPSGATIVSFSAGQSAIAAAAVGASGGTGYVVGDVLTVVQGSASGGQVSVSTVGVGGAVTGVTPVFNGSGYTNGTNLATTGGTGSGCQINITGLTASITLSQNPIGSGLSTFTVYVGPPLIPIAALNVYIALASASLVQARWQDTWTLGMALYVAHFATLYLRSEGLPGTAPGKAALLGLKQGITVSMSAGPVSQGLQPTQGLEEWGSWTETSYGRELATFAKVIGMGPMYLL